MATIYQGSGNKYELSTTALESAASDKGWFGNLLAAINPVTIISDLITDIQKNINIRRRDEQGYLLKADELGYSAENELSKKIFIIVIIVIILVVVLQKK